MTRRIVLAAAVVLAWLAFATTAFCQESLDAMDARLESERLSIESDRRALNQDCKHVPESDTLLMEVCGKLQKSVLERMTKWKQESARLQTLRCADLSERLKRWEIGALRAAQVIRKNDAMIAEAQADRHQEALKAGRAGWNVAKSALIDKAEEALVELSMSKSALEQAVGDWRTVQGHERGTLTPQEVKDFQKTGKDMVRRMGGMMKVLKAYKEAYKENDTDGVERLRLTMGQEVERFRNDFLVKADGGEAVGALLADVLGGPGGKLAFEATVAGITAFTATAGAGVDNLELRKLRESQEVMGRELVKAQEQIRSLRAQMQTRGCR